MYLHIGHNVVISQAEIIGIFDMDNTTGSQITRSFLSEKEKSGNLTVISDDLPKSFIVCGQESSQERTIEVYLSQLSSQTLYKRSGEVRFE